jgi:tetratricopeptide (TPR) repeat protein
MRLSALILLISLAAVAPVWAGGPQDLDKGLKCNNSGEYQMAVDFLTKAVSSGELDQADLRSAYVFRAFAHKKMSQFTAALEDYGRAAENKPEYENDPFFLVGRGEAYMGNGDLERARADFEKAVKLDPQSGAALNSRAVLHRKTGEFEKAVQDHQKALALSPWLWQGMADLAWLMATCPEEKYRNGEKAVEMSEKAVRYRITPHTLDALAAAYAESGDFTRAVEVQEAAVYLLTHDWESTQTEDFKKRLETYQAGNPWREEILKER